MEMATISYGCYNEPLPVSGMSIAQIRNKYGNRFDIDPRTTPFVDGQEATEDTIVPSDSTLLFCRSSGEREKAMGSFEYARKALAAIDRPDHKEKTMAPLPPPPPRRRSHLSALPLIKNYHGGCDGCMRAGRAYPECMGCQFYKSDWNLPDLNTSNEDHKARVHVAGAWDADYKTQDELNKRKGIARDVELRNMMDIFPLREKVVAPKKKTKYDTKPDKYSTLPIPKKTSRLKKIVIFVLGSGAASITGHFIVKACMEAGIL